MVMFLGSLMVVDLRLLGAGLTHQPVAVVARDARPWLLGALVVLVLTGIPAMMATATLQYANSVFWVKMYLLGLGLDLHVHGAQPRGLRRGGPRRRAARHKLVGLLSIVIWLSVAALARLIMMIPANTFEWLVGGGCG